MSDVDCLAVPYQVALEVPQTVMNNDAITAVIQWFVTNVLSSHPLAGGGGGSLAYELVQHL